MILEFVYNSPAGGKCDLLGELHIDNKICNFEKKNYVVLYFIVLYLNFEKIHFSSFSISFK